MAVTLSKIRGCIVGGALGDAIGLFTEFLSSEQSLAQYGPNPRFSLTNPPPPGFKTIFLDRHRAMFDESSWTDDTDQSLLILMSFLNSGGQNIDSNDFARRLKHWVQSGFRPLDRLPLGLGRTVGSVVRSSGFLDDPKKLASEIWTKGGCGMAANGAVMRTPVIGALLFNDMDKLYTSSIGIAATTHADPRCLVSCTVVSALVAAIIRGEIESDEDIRRIVSAATEPVIAHDPPLEEKHIQEMNTIIWKDELSDLQLDESSSIGYTYKCLASGVWALRKALPPVGGEGPKPAVVFERLITQLTMAGGDSDTNCAVAGSLLGALFGYDGLPSHWKQGLKHHEWLVAKADAAASFILGDSVTGIPYDYESDSDNLIDGGKGEMSREELDGRWKVLIETLHTRLGDFERLKEHQRARKKKDDGCVIS